MICLLNIVFFFLNLFIHFFLLIQINFEEKKKKGNFPQKIYDTYETK